MGGFLVYLDRSTSPAIRDVQQFTINSIRVSVSHNHNPSPTSTRLLSLVIRSRRILQILFYYNACRPTRMKIKPDGIRLLGVAVSEMVLKLNDVHNLTFGTWVVLPEIRMLYT